MKPYPDWAYIRFHRLQLDYVVRDGDFDEQAIVLFSDTTQMVVQCNELAASAGICAGMPLADAWLLCENLQTLPSSQQFEQRLLEEQALALYEHVADIALDNDGPGLWLRLSRLHKLFRDEQTLLVCIRQVVQELVVTIALADSPRAAQFYAQKNAPSLQASRLEPMLISALARVGLTSAEQVLSIPVAIAGRKFGDELVNWVHQMQGQCGLPLVFFQPRSGFYQSVQLTTEVVTWQGLRFALHRLLQDLESYLREHQQATTRLEVQIGNRAGKWESVPLQLAAPAYRAEQFFALLQIVLEKRALRTPALYLALIVSTFEPLAAQSATLEQTAISAQMTLQDLLARLQTRLQRGQPERLYTLSTTSHWMPDTQQQMVATSGYPAGTCHHQLRDEWRPCWLTAPQPVQINEWQLATRRQRLVSPWWCGQPVQYDYALARHAESGRWAWLRQTQEQQGAQAEPWMLVGWAC